MVEDRRGYQKTSLLTESMQEDPMVGKLIDNRYMLHDCLGEGAEGEDSAVNDRLALELEHDAQRAVGRRMDRPEVEHHPLGVQVERLDS